MQTTYIITNLDFRDKLLPINRAMQMIVVPNKQIKMIPNPTDIAMTNVLTTVSLCGGAIVDSIVTVLD